MRNGKKHTASTHSAHCGDDDDDKTEYTHSKSNEKKSFLCLCLQIGLSRYLSFSDFVLPKGM